MKHLLVAVDGGTVEYITMFDGETYGIDQQGCVVIRDRNGEAVNTIHGLFMEEIVTDSLGDVWRRRYELNKVIEVHEQ